MNETKKQYRREARRILVKNGICFDSLNNDLHWKIGSVNFFPTTGLWRDESNEEQGNGVKSLISYLKPKEENKQELNKKYCIKKLSVEQLFQIAAHSKDKSLEGICKAIHTEIYK